MKLGPYTRLAAALVALVAWAGLGLQFHTTLGREASVGATLWILLRFFTVLANLWLAVQLTGIALGLARFADPKAIASVTVSMLLVGVVYGVLLNGLLELSGGDLAADFLLHKATPVLALVFWLGFTPKGRLGAGDPPRWLIIPAVYLVYALGRGLAGDIYAYPFLDIGKLGAARVALNVGVMAVVYLAGGYGFVWVDKALRPRV